VSRSGRRKRAADIGIVFRSAPVVSLAGVKTHNACWTARRVLCSPPPLGMIETFGEPDSGNRIVPHLVARSRLRQGDSR
jgi:hypothetical protein